MTEDPFATPASADSVPWGELLGRLLVVEPTDLEKGIPTSLGPADAVRARVHVIDQDVPKTYEDALIFPRVLISQLRSKIGQMVLGRMEQGVAKPGQTAPWRMAEPTDQDKALGGAWLRARKSTAFAQPATTAPAPPF